MANITITVEEFQIYFANSEVFEFIDLWDGTAQYFIGDLVLFGKKIYVSLTVHLLNVPPIIDTVNWAISSETENLNEYTTQFQIYTAIEKAKNTLYKGIYQCVLKRLGEAGVKEALYYLTAHYLIALSNLMQGFTGDDLNIKSKTVGSVSLEYGYPNGYAARSPFLSTPFGKYYYDNFVRLCASTVRLIPVCNDAI